MEQKKTLGLMTVTGCYVLWGILAIFWRFLAQVNSVYVLAQRIIWSLVFMGSYSPIKTRDQMIRWART